MKYVNFNFDLSKKFTIIIPDFKNKFNYYYEPTPELHKFDSVQIFWVDVKNNVNVFLKEDMIEEILCRFYGSIKMAINEEIVLFNFIEKYSLGRLLNQSLNYLDDLDLSGYWMFSSNRDKAVLIYNFDNKIYLEIIPIYPWTFRDPLLVENYVSFEEFMATYKPYVVEEIPLAVAIAWKDQAETLLRELNSACL